MGSKNEIHTKQTSVRFKASDYEKVAEIARKDGRNTSCLIRKIVSDYVDRVESSEIRT